MLVFDERHDVRVTLDINDHELLARVLLLVGVLQDIEDVAPLNMEYDFLKRNASGLLKQSVLLRAPGKVLHNTNVVQRVPFVNTGLTVRVQRTTPRRGEGPLE